MGKASENHFIWGTLGGDRTFIMEKRREGLGSFWGTWELSSVILRTVMWKREKNWSFWIPRQKPEPLGRNHRKTCFHSIWNCFLTLITVQRWKETVLENSEFFGAGIPRLAGICCEDFSIGLMMLWTFRSFLTERSHDSMKVWYRHFIVKIQIFVKWRGGKDIWGSADHHP